MRPSGQKRPREPRPSSLALPSGLLADWAEVALANAERPYPRVEPLFLSGPRLEAYDHREAHPAFYGAYDWHSAVEMHWLLARLLCELPAGLERRIHQLFDDHLDAASLAVEEENLPGSELPYGYAWTLLLARELASCEHPAARRWCRALDPLVARVSRGLSDWLEVATYPVRSGLHSNSAFSLSLALRYARRHDEALADRIEQKAWAWYGGDTDYPTRFEPSGTDFLSPALTEAELMSQLLGSVDFSGWLAAFLPGLAGPGSDRAFVPAVVSDPSRGQIAHLHGLNLSRAWCLRRLQLSLPPGDKRKPLLAEAVEVHAAASLEAAVGSDYMVEHWLVAYAVLLATDV